MAPIPPLKETKMSERLETLNKARARMLEDRDVHAKVLAAPFDRDKAERARNKFIEIQILIDALDRAIGGERTSRQQAEPAALGGSRQGMIRDSDRRMSFAMAGDG